MRCSTTPHPPYLGLIVVEKSAVTSDGPTYQGHHEQYGAETRRYQRLVGALVRAVSFSTAVLMLVVLSSTNTHAQYRYVDDQGVVHWVQSPNQIPRAYRDKIEQPKLPEIDAGKGEDPAARTGRKAFDAEQERKRAREKAAEDQQTARERAERAEKRARDAAKEAVEEEERARSSRFKEATEQCRRQAGNQVFVKPGNEVSMLGSNRQHFEFEKCMTESGIQLKSTP